MGIVISFPADRCSVRTGVSDERDDGSSVIILPVVRIERHEQSPAGAEPGTSSPRGKRRKR